MSNEPTERRATIRMREILEALPDVGELTEDAVIESLGDVGGEGRLMLVFAENRKFLEVARGNPCVSCIVTTPDLLRNQRPGCSLLLTATPRKSFFVIHNYLAEHTSFYWTDFPSEISPETEIHPAAYLAPKNVRIAKGALLEPGVIVMERAIIGENVVLRAGTIVASEGFEFKKMEHEVLRVAHAGGVRLEERVEVQSNCAIDRSVFGGFTEIGQDTKIDNLVHVGHGVRIGARCLIAAGATIAGSTKIADDVWIGPGACLSDHLTIGSRAFVSLGAVVTRDVDPGQRVSGNFAIDHAKLLKHVIGLSK